MKKIVLTVMILLLFAMPAAAKDIISLQTGTDAQSMFKDLSRDFGLAISYYPLSPAQSLAGSLIPIGFDVGLEVTAVQLDTSKEYWKVMGPDAPKLLPVPKLHAQFGFKIPMTPIPPIDLGVMYSMVPTTDIKLLGGEVKIGILEDGLVMPALAVRGAMTKLTGIEDMLEIDTKSLDISVSKKILLVTPYLGYGMVQITSTPKDPVATTDVVVGGAVLYKGLTKEEITENKLFAGLKLSLGLINFVVEYTMAAVNAYSFRANVSF